MEWDQAKIDAAVSTLTEALGTICDVEVEFIEETQRVGHDGYPVPEGDLPYVTSFDETIEGTQKTIITITPREGS